MIDLLQEEPDPVKRQIAIELLTTNDAARCGDKTAAVTVANGVHKHVLQLIEQTFQEMR
jgi:hypothetical protein